MRGNPGSDHPGGDGRQEKTFEKIRRIDPETKVIVASGYSNDPVMTNYKAEGFQGVLPKPFTVEELAQTLSHICG